MEKIDLTKMSLGEAVAYAPLYCEAKMQEELGSFAPEWIATTAVIFTEAQSCWLFRVYTFNTVTKEGYAGEHRRERVDGQSIDELHMQFIDEIDRKAWLLAHALRRHIEDQAGKDLAAK